MISPYIASNNNATGFWLTGCTCSNNRYFKIIDLKLLCLLLQSFLIYAVVHDLLFSESCAWINEHNCFLSCIWLCSLNEYSSHSSIVAPVQENTLSSSPLSHIKIHDYHKLCLFFFITWCKEKWNFHLLSEIKRPILYHRKIGFIFIQIHKNDLKKYSTSSQIWIIS